VRWLLDYVWIYLATAAAVVGLLRWRRVLRGVRRGWRRVSGYRAVIVAVPVLVSLALSAWMGRERDPMPGVHDEFSYLLGADTFARGRLANPPHPMWEHFETIHVLQRPTYASKYPPGQALALALGQVLGKPIVGAWLGVALAAGAVGWMLRAFVPARWALLGGVLTAIHPQMLEWGQVYWGGGMAALGGALVVGAAGRLVQCRSRRPPVTCGAMLGAGLAILANTRPYEGLVVAAVVLVLALLWSRDRARMIRAAALPAGAVLAASFAWMAYYDFRTTGNPFTLPYTLHEAAYGSVPLFAWEPPREIPLYRNQRLWAFWAQWVFDEFAARRLSAAGLLYDARLRLETLRQHLFPMGWTALPLLMLPLMHLRNPRMRAIEIGFLAFVAASALCTYFSAAYWAPATGLGVLVYVQCVRYVAALRVKVRASGRRLAAGQGLMAIMLVALAMMSASWKREYARIVRYPTWRDERATRLAELEERPGEHLVIVRYPPGYSVHAEWVYNDAEIDGARVVFAHDLGHARNRPLLEYFADRRAWLLMPGSSEGLKPYPSIATPTAASRPATER